MPRTMRGIAESALRSWPDGRSHRPRRSARRGTAPPPDAGRARASRHRRRAPRREQPVLHRPAVDEQILMVGDAAIEGRQAGDAAQLQPFPLEIDAMLFSTSARSVSAATRVGQVLARPAPPVRGARHARPRTRCRAAPSRAASPHRCTPHIRRAERRNLRRAGTRANRSSTRTRVPGGSAAGPSATSRHCRRRAPAIRAAHPAFERQPRDAGDRGQRLAAKAQRRDRLDRVIGQLRGRVAFQRERHFGRRSCRTRHPHFDPSHAARRRFASRCESPRHRSRFQPVPSTHWRVVRPLHRQRYD
jgi:hypothetical protein